VSVKNKDPDVGNLMKSALRMWGKSSPYRFFFFLRIGMRFWRSYLHRLLIKKRIGEPFPSVIAVSPTMRCNYNCMGCYSNDRPVDDELTKDELDSLFFEAAKLGIYAVVLTGGEPLMRSDMIDLIERHRRLLFVLITNGVLVSPEVAGRIARSSNVITLVSIEGQPRHTEERRGEGSHATALRALTLLKENRACYGFATTVTTSNGMYVTNDEFIDEMTRLGCSVGYLVEYVPCGPKARPEWVPGVPMREEIRRRVLNLRSRKPLILVHFPDDEYGSDNRCSSAGIVSFHINSQGEIEPCPFVSISRENIRQGGLITAFKSAFLYEIRKHPELLQRKNYACALFEHQGAIKSIASGKQVIPAEHVKKTIIKGSNGTV
jgi:MoaA/NifB/PqqE/SkfB family radical SAM enzyme